MSIPFNAYLSGVTNTSAVILDSLKHKLDLRKQESSLRKLTSAEALIDFTSNDYLGLSRSKTLFDEIHKKTSSIGPSNGATGSRLLSGNSPFTEEVEKQLASIFRSEAALIFNSGYTANLAVLSSVPQRHDTILYDELAHACIKDGARLSLARHFSFRHNDLDDLESKLKRVIEGNTFIAVESIYSMDGDQCPLTELVNLADRYNATIIIDEAHSTGVMGDHGGGLTVKLGLESKIPLRIYTFGKGMGIHGACVAGSKILCDYLINFARPFIYTTALPPHSVASISCAFNYLDRNMSLQDDLHSRIELFLRHTKNFSHRIVSKSAIQTAVFPGNANVKNAAVRLQQRGLDVRPILSPTVPAGSERLRICLHTYNTDEEIILLASALQELDSQA